MHRATVTTKQAVILCGGLGTRLRPLTDNVPKPMIPVEGRPLLYYIMTQLSRQGVCWFVLLTGYLSHKIEEFFGDGSQFDWRIVYSQGPADWDTGRRVWEAREHLEERFWLLYSDNYAYANLRETERLHTRNKAVVTVTACRKAYGNLRVNDQDLVDEYDNSRTQNDMEFVEVGYMLVSRDEVLRRLRVCESFPDVSFSVVLRSLASERKLSARKLATRYYSISDPKRLEQTRAVFANRNTILIDRDGIINEKAPRGEYVSQWSDFVWIEDTVVAMKNLAAAGFQFVIVTNQAGIARGMVDPTDLRDIHDRMNQRFTALGVPVRGIYVCPHHWDEGCWCRKPNPGMLIQASEEHGFLLNRVLFIGDDPRDCTTAYNSGCASVFVGDEHDLDDLPEEHKPLIAGETLSVYVTFIRDYYREME